MRSERQHHQCKCSGSSWLERTRCQECCERICSASCPHAAHMVRCSINNRRLDSRIGASGAGEHFGTSPASKIAQSFEGSSFRRFGAATSVALTVYFASRPSIDPSTTSPIARGPNEPRHRRDSLMCNHAPHARGSIRLEGIMPAIPI